MVTPCGVTIGRTDSLNVWLAVTKHFLGMARHLSYVLQFITFATERAKVCLDFFFIVCVLLSIQSCCFNVDWLVCVVAQCGDNFDLHATTAVVALHKFG